MARATFESRGWLPEESSSAVIQKVSKASAVEAFARSVPMTTAVVKVPRSGGFSVGVTAKGAGYNEDVTANDEVTLTARKITGAIRIAEEDIEDAKFVDILGVKKLEWAGSYARYIDNATLAVTAAEGTNVPFTSVYRVLSQTDSGLGYTANANIIKTAGAVTYDDLSDVFGLVEGGSFFDEARTVVIAHPSFRGVLRGLKDTAGNPIFVDGLAGSPGTLFGIPVQWTAGAKTHATATDAPSGNPLLVVANADYLLLGKRSEPESIVIDGRESLTDEVVLKMRSRRGFALGHPGAAAAIEVTAS